MGLSEQEIEGDLKEHPHHLLGGLTPRERMHEISQELFKQHGDDYLARQLEASLHNHKANSQRVVIDDVRFPANVNLIRQYEGSEIWRIFSNSINTRDAYDTGKLEEQTFDLELKHEGNPHDLRPAILQYLAASS